jgi:membrane protein
MDRLVTWFDRLQRRSRTALYVLAVWRKFCDDQAGSLAAQLAYYAFLALFPLLLVLVTVLGIVLQDYPATQQWILHSALIDFPIIGTQLRSSVHSVGRSGVGLLIGLIGTGIGARGLSMASQRAFNTAWSVPYTKRPSFFGRQLRSLALLVVIGIAILTTGALSGTASVGGLRGWPISVGALLISSALNLGFFLLGFRLATSRQIPTADFARAAIGTAVAWQILLSLGSYLIAHELRHTEEVYGLFGLVLGLLAWLHVQAQLTLVLLEAEVVSVQRLWPRALTGDRPMEDGDLPAMKAFALAQQRRPDITITVAVDPLVQTRPPLQTASGPRRPDDTELRRAARARAWARSSRARRAALPGRAAPPVEAGPGAAGQGAPGTRGPLRVGRGDDQDRAARPPQAGTHHRAAPQPVPDATRPPAPPAAEDE